MMNEPINQVIVKKPIGKKISSILLWTISSLFCITVLILTYFPLLIIFMTSISTDRLGMSMPGLTIEWYQKIFAGGDLTDSIVFTLEITVLSTLISIIFGTLSAIGINSLNSKLRKKMIILNNVPILNADIVTGVFLLIIFQIVSIIVGKSIFGFTTTLIAHILFSTPYVILSVLPKLSELDDHLYDAATDLGCNPFKTLMKVIIPSIKSGIFSGGLLAFTMSIDDFIITHFTTGNQGNFSTWLFSGLRTMNHGIWNQACAYNSLLTCITIISVIIYMIIKTKRQKEKIKK